MGRKDPVNLYYSLTLKMCIRDRFFTIGDHQNLVCQIECRNFEVSFLVVVSVYQVVVIQPVSYTHLDVYKRQQHHGTTVHVLCYLQ